jgi:hypothetical protein
MRSQAIFCLGYQRIFGCGEQVRLMGRDAADDPGQRASGLADGIRAEPVDPAP